MAMRFGQMVLAVAGMVFVLRYGLERTPAWGEATGTLPAHWTVHPVALGVAIVCPALELGLISARNE